ncbi:transglutaminase domain-containing protein [Rhodoflexus sp.]
MAQINEVPTVIVRKKRTLLLQIVHQQIRVTSQNLLIIRHGTKQANLTDLERIGYSKFNKLLKVKAYTITPRGDTLHVTAFSDQSTVQAGVFYDDYMERVFLFPGVVAGAVSHLYYTEELLEPRFLGVYYFNSSFPVQQSEFEIVFDRNIRVDFSAFHTEKVVWQQKKHRKGWSYLWTAANVPVFRRKPGEQSISYRAPHVIPRISYYQFSDKLKIPLLSNVADLYAWYGGLVEGVGKEEMDSKTLLSLVDSLTAGMQSTEQKARAIFTWVQQNIHYIAFEDGYGGLIPRKATDVLRKRYGDCKDMTALLVALMRHAGIEAYFTWIGTRRLPYRYTELPTPMVDNHMIATIKLGEQLIFLDATDTDLPFGMPSAMIQGKEALIGKSRYTYEIKTVPIVAAHRNTLEDSVVIKLQPEEIYVAGRVVGSGYFKSELNTRQAVFNTRNLIGLEWGVVSLSDSVRAADYTYRQQQAITQQDRQLYFNPHTIAGRHDEKWLPGEQTFNHWEFEHTFKLVQQQLIVLPEGWEVERLPTDAATCYSDFGFEIRYEKKETSILISRTIFVNTLLVDQQRVTDWQQLMEKYSYATRQNIIFRQVH